MFSSQPKNQGKRQLVYFMNENTTDSHFTRAGVIHAGTLGGYMFEPYQDAIVQVLTPQMQPMEELHVVFIRWHVSNLMSLSIIAEVWDAVAALVLQWPKFRLSRTWIPLGESWSTLDHRWEISTGLMSQGVTVTIILMMWVMQCLRVQRGPEAAKLESGTINTQMLVLLMQSLSYFVYYKPSHWKIG